MRASLKKNPHKNCHREKKSGVERSGISLLFSKSMPWLLQVYIDPVFNLYMTLLCYHQDEKLMKRLIFETSGSCPQISFPCFKHFGTPFSNGKNKTKWDSAHVICCNGRHLSLVHCGSYLATTNVATRRWWKRCCISR